MVGAVHVDRLLIILCLEARIRKIHRRLLEILADARVICEHPIRVTPDASPISLSSLLVEHALLLLLVLEIHLVPVHHGIVLISSRLDLVSKF